MNLLKRILFPNTYSSEAYINYLRDKGVSIGDNCIIWSPNNVLIDTQRPECLHIGNYCKITKDVKILCHDYSMSVARRKFHRHVGVAKTTYIGDNVFIGMGATILMGAHIGNNCIVGAGSVVSGKFGDDVVIAGNPARVICTIEEYYNKHLSEEFESAKDYFLLLKAHKKETPTIEDMGNAFAWLYLPRTEEIFNRYKHFFRLSGDSFEDVKADFLASEGQFESYEAFVSFIENGD